MNSSPARACPERSRRGRPTVSSEQVLLFVRNLVGAQQGAVFVFEGSLPKNCHPEAARGSLGD